MSKKNTLRWKSRYLLVVTTELDGFQLAAQSATVVDTNARWNVRVRTKHGMRELGWGIGGTRQDAMRNAAEFVRSGKAAEMKELIEKH
jgi:hypothetical protein